MSMSIRAVAVIELGDCGRDDCSHPALKYAERNLKGQSLISRMVRRLSESPLVQQIVISGEQLPTNILTAGIPGAVVLNCPHSHVIERLAAAADRTDSDWVVFLPGNRPFVDPVLIDRLLSDAGRATDCDYVGFFSPRGGWARMQQLGLAAEVCHADALRRLRRNLDRITNRTEDLSLSAWFQDAPGVYQMRFIPVPAELDRGDLRFAVENERDWDNAQMLCDSIPGDETQWQPLAEIALANTELHLTRDE
jgi:spore coat polysaccharide biosynthesis protein SpsF (cytidylyltransferase family)